MEDVRLSDISPEKSILGQLLAAERIVAVRGLEEGGDQELLFNGYKASVMGD